MNVLDWAFVAVVALGGWNGYRNGLIRQITRLFGVVIAYFVSLWVRPYVAPVVRSMHLFPQKLPPNSLMNTMLGDVSGAVAFAGVFVITFLLLRYAVGLIDALFSLPVISFVNRMAGLVVGLILALIFAYVVTLVLHYVQNPAVQSQLKHSAIVHWFNANQSNIPYINQFTSGGVTHKSSHGSTK